MVSCAPRMIVLLMVTVLILQIMILLRISHGIFHNVKQATIWETNQWNAASGVSTVHKTVLISKRGHITTETSTEFPGLQMERKRRLTIGIPTVIRQGGSYVVTMFDTMLSKTSPKHLNEIVFVICLAENKNTTWKEEMTKLLNTKYKNHVKHGSLIIIDIPLSFYKTMRSFEDGEKSWQIKQSFDFAYMMKYSRHLSEYYLQMEDDVTTANDYYPDILKYVKSQRIRKWVCLEFSELGFIGKLYHSYDLADLADMILKFNSTAPVDVTYLKFNRLRGQYMRRIRKPTLFQHVGVNSSLAGKIQLLKDTEFKDDLPEKELNGDNPPATMYTSFVTNRNFPPDLAYSNKRGYFWTKRPPRENDRFTVIFDKPQSLSHVVIVTGLENIPYDMLYSAVVESSAILNGKSKCLSYVAVGVFHNGIANITESEITGQIGSAKTVCLNVRVTKSQKYWAAIKEIAVFIK